MVFRPHNSLPTSQHTKLIDKTMYKATVELALSLILIFLSGSGEYHNPHSSRTCRACRKLEIRGGSSGRFESCGQLCCQQLLNGTMQAAPGFDKSTGRECDRRTVPLSHFSPCFPGCGLSALVFKIHNKMINEHDLSGFWDYMFAQQAIIMLVKKVDFFR